MAGELNPNMLETRNANLKKGLPIGPRLKQLEKVVEKSMAEFERLGAERDMCMLEAGAALAEIRDGKLYREYGHKFFKDYCLERWGFEDAARARQLIAAAKTVEISTVSGLPSPANEGQAKELGRAEDPAEVWAEVVEQHDPAEITAAVIREHVEARKPVPIQPDAVDFAAYLGNISQAVRAARQAGATTQEIWNAYQAGLST